MCRALSAVGETPKAACVEEYLRPVGATDMHVVDCVLEVQPFVAWHPLCPQRSLT
jgi:hypothetical protein